MANVITEYFLEFLSSGVDRSITTSELYGFYKEARSHYEMLVYVVELASQSDFVRVRSSTALIEGESNPERKLKLQYEIDNPDVAINKVKKNSKIITQNALNGIVNAFNRYLVSILHRSANMNPVIFASSQQVRVDEILKMKNKDEIFSWIVDRKINELAYQSISELEKFVQDRIGINLFQNEYDRKCAMFCIEVRNVNTHNAGIINDLFIRRVPYAIEFGAVKGSYFHSDFNKLMEYGLLFCQSAQYIDDQISQKFRIKRKRFKKWTDINPKK